MSGFGSKDSARRFRPGLRDRRQPSGLAAIFKVEERGRIADLLRVAGDLEGDLSRTTAIAGVWKDGFPVEAAWAAPQEPR